MKAWALYKGSRISVEFTDLNPETLKARITYAFGMRWDYLESKYGWSIKEITIIQH